ncbi:MAG: hypothetical protein ACOYN0_02120 [Phycisphaerales bacterium]
MSSLAARWSTFPRAIRWAVLAGAGIAFYFGVAEPVLDATALIKSRADAKAAVLAQYQQNRLQLESADKMVAVGVSRLGNIEMPVASETRAVEFNRVIDEILSRHDLADRSSTSRSVPLGNNAALNLVVDSADRVERLVTDLQIVAEPEAIAQIIADFERHPLVTTISRVQMRKAEGRDSGRSIRATLSVETWVLVKKARTR